MDEYRFGAIEAILFVAGEAVALEDIARALQLTLIETDSLIDKMAAEMLKCKRGIEIVRLEDKVQLRTSKRYSKEIQEALSPLKERTLSASLLETLSIIAYKQPITRSEIEAIKGVSADYSIRTLLSMKLIKIVGRKDVLGRPLLYGTTDEFLRHFGITSLNELPPLPVLPKEEEMISEI